MKLVDCIKANDKFIWRLWLYHSLNIDKSNFYKSINNLQKNIIQL